MTFDAYQKWLENPPEEQPPSCYRLLGIRNFESDPDVVEAAAERTMAFLRGKGSGPHARDSQRLLNEVSNARLKLLKPEIKASYDRALKDKLGEETTSQPQPGTLNLKPGTSNPAVKPSTELVSNFVGETAHQRRIGS